MVGLIATNLDANVDVMATRLFLALKTLLCLKMLGLSQEVKGHHFKYFKICFHSFHGTSADVSKIFPWFS